MNLNYVMDSELTPENIIAAINELRTGPKEYARKLDARLADYEEYIYKDSTGALYKSKEGKAACQEAIDVLTKTEPLPKLEASQSLNKCAKDRVKDLCDNGVSENSRESNSFSLADRLDATGLKWSGNFAEILAAQAITCQDVMTKWLIDDGISSRTNRKSLLAKHFTCAGVYSTKHAEYGHLTAVIAVDRFDKVIKPSVNHSLLDILPATLKRPEALGMTIDRATTIVGDMQRVKYDVAYHLPDGNVDRKSAVNIEKKPEQGDKKDGPSLDANPSHDQPVKQKEAFVKAIVEDGKAKIKSVSNVDGLSSVSPADNKTVSPSEKQVANTSDIKANSPVDKKMANTSEIKRPESAFKQSLQANNKIGESSTSLQKAVADSKISPLKVTNKKDDKPKSDARNADEF
jgi:uncharacterized protein YkwD